MAVEYATTYERSWAIVIGIDRYAALPPLRHAVADARAVAQTLIEAYGFDPARVVQLYDAAATANTIHRLLEHLNKPGVIGRDDRMIFFLAGHGLTRRAPQGEAGYFAPVDARREDWGTLIPFTAITDRTDSLPAKHIFYIMDACYSGHVVLRGLADRASEEFIARFSRQILTAGLDDEMVADGGGPGGRNSIFTGHLLDGLRGEASDVRGMLSASSLISYVYRSVINDPRAHQTPFGGWLRGDGDFIFRSATPQNLPAHFFRRMESGSEGDRLGAVADLALLAVAMPDPVGKEALKALEAVAATDPHDLVKRTARYCLFEALRMLKDGEPVAVTRLDEARRLVEVTNEDAFMVGRPNAGAALELAKSRLVEVGTRQQGALSGPVATGVIQAPSPGARMPGRPSPGESVRRKPARRLSAAGLSAVLFMILALFLAMAGAILLLARHNSAQAAMIEALKASSAGATMASLIDVQQATLEGTAANQLLVTKQAQATALAQVSTAAAPTVSLAGLEAGDPGLTPTPPPVAPTATLPPTATPAAPGPLVFVDDFGGDRGWLLPDDPEATIQVRDGRLHFELAKPFALWYALPGEDLVPALGDFVLDVEAQEFTPLTDGALLILVRGQSPGADSVSEDGDALLESYICIGVQSNGQAFMFVQTGGQPLTPLVPLQTLPQGPLPAGQPLQIRVESLGDTLTVYVNGIQTLSVTSDVLGGGSLASGRVALGVWSHSLAPYHAAFDNLSISLPDY